ncbi:MAG: AAA family ATPase [Planctomycetes bacterium]|nr:AAA family ATPase [Planctomycetota bacterium]
MKDPILERISPATQRIRNLQKQLSELFVGKEEIIRLLGVCTAAREPLLLVGEPGTAKSDLIVEFCNLMGIRRSGAEAGGDGPGYFEFLLTPFTEPSEVFGPVNIDDYTRRQVYTRASRGMLQESAVVFLDEVFKANSAILNSLLTILNERKFYDAGRAVPVPLVVLFGATNEVPSGGELAALFDRFTLRVECLNLRTEEQMRELLRRGARRESLRSRRMLGEEITLTPSGPMPALDDFTQVFRAAVERLDDPEFGRRNALFLDTFLRKVSAIRQDELTGLNDRKVIKLLKLMVVQALLEGREPDTVEHQLLEWTWDNPFDSEARRRLQAIAREGR